MDTTRNDIISAHVDWSGAAGNDRATLLRTRGWFSVVNDAAADGAFHWYIAMQDADLVPPAPTLAATYDEEDILATGGYQFEASTIKPFLYQIDVKAMRRMSRDDNIVFVSRATGAAVRISFVMRALVRRGGN